MSMIKIKDVIYEYLRKNELGEVEETVQAVDGVTIDIEKGEIVAILGHNGSGKSTLAKHLNGILKPTKGAIYIKEMDTKDEKYLLDIRQTTGMVFQNPDNQIIGTVVEEDVAFGPENLGIPTSEIWERVEKSLEAVHMTAYREHSPNKLSGGQKQRIAIAGVVAMEPECIVLDEPTAMLDPVGRKDVLDAVMELNEKKNITIILITHNMDEVVFADKVYVMDHGKVVLKGTPREIFSNVEVMKQYGLEVPVATELAYWLKKEGIDISTNILTKEELVEQLCQLN
ncbi:MAG: energy-coupling factor transporter ATPase [Firmicutes bacterium]|uniref:Energy-coupling factor transporter ATPase n=1 Tax=Candidatus Scybalomonas excrementavium TaxID=2840943 RepID=A0A9D9I074_9FIRM|nr:energy-coupling factor transporter ATPase [Candidatus Scybalomonas excrementavium]